MSIEVIIAMILYASCAFIIVAMMTIRQRQWYEWNRTLEQWEPCQKPNRISYSHTKTIRGDKIRIFRSTTKDDRYFVALDQT